MSKWKNRAKNAAKEVAKEMGAEKGREVIDSLITGGAEGAKEGAREYLKNRISREERVESARVKFWMSVLRNLEIKEGMTLEKAAKKLQKIQSDYKESRPRPYKTVNADGDKVNEPYGKTEEDRLNKALAIFAMYLNEEDFDEFQLLLAGMSRKNFDAFIETVLEDSVHRVIRFISQLLDLSYKKAKQLAKVIADATLNALNFTLEKLAGAEHYDTENTWEGLMIVLARGVEAADATVALGLDVTDIALDATNEVMDNAKKKGWLWNLLIASRTR